MGKCDRSLKNNPFMICAEQSIGENVSNNTFLFCDPPNVFWSNNDALCPLLYRV